MYRKDMRPEIVDSFLQEFNAHGCRLTLDSVSARIHISKKTIYRFFRSKDDIYAHIVNEAIEDLEARQQEVMEEVSLSPMEKLSRLLSLRSPWEDKVDFSLLPALASDSPSAFAILLAAVSSTSEKVQTLLEEGQRKGEVNPSLHPDCLARIVESSVSSFLTTDALSQTHLHFSEAMAQFTTMFLFGIQNR